jgi:hypothetical protein
MLETRREMQRAKLESMSRARMKREDELAVTAPGVAADAAGLSPIDLVDTLPSADLADPLRA